MAPTIRSLAVQKVFQDVPHFRQVTRDRLVMKELPHRGQDTRFPMLLLLLGNQLIDHNDCVATAFATIVERMNS